MFTTKVIQANSQTWDILKNSIGFTKQGKRALWVSQFSPKKVMYN
jgi:hypothetical protein